MKAIANKGFCAIVGQTGKIQLYIITQALVIPPSSGPAVGLTDSNPLRHFATLLVPQLHCG